MRGFAQSMLRVRAVGFLMLFEEADEGEYFLWCLIVDAQYLGPLFIGSMVETVLEVPKVSTVSSFSLLFIGRTMALISPTRTKGLQYISPTKSTKNAEVKLISQA